MGLRENQCAAAAARWGSGLGGSRPTVGRTGLQFLHTTQTFVAHSKQSTRVHCSLRKNIPPRYEAKTAVTVLRKNTMMANIIIHFTNRTIQNFTILAKKMQQLLKEVKRY
mmetsp:Transcript_35954/g.70753  ORF Transcript_35954/g.70753 Transcript_35954/m.70753 type:complete len:110 (+) Transcript_35954:1787-2116(+)